MRGPATLTCEEIQWDGCLHRLVTSWRRMQVVAAIVGGQQLIGMLRIAYHSIEIDHRVEVS